MAFDCAARLPGLRVISCQGAVKTALRILPQDLPQIGKNSLTVTGTYSSGDRFGIEGLAIRNGEVISHRFQKWDGVLLIDATGGVSLHNVRRVNFGGRDFNLRDTTQRRDFLDLARQTKLSLLQSHLLISDGVLDLRDVADAPLFKRRMIFQDGQGRFGLYETEGAQTLYAAALEAQSKFQPEMLFNLDMGAYDYCFASRVTEGQVTNTDCGNLLVPVERLTNLLEFILPAE